MRIKVKRKWFLANKWTKKKLKKTKDGTKMYLKQYSLFIRLNL